MPRTSPFLLGVLLVSYAATAGAQTVFDQLPQTIPGYDARFGIPLLVRAQTRLRDLGIDLGPVSVQPAVEAGILYDSNVRGGAHARGSAVAATQAMLGIQRSDPGLSWAGFVNVDDRRYLDAPEQSRTNWSASVGGAMKLVGGTLTLAAAHLALHQERTDLDALPSDTPIGFQLEDVRASYSYRFNRLTLVPNIEFTIYRFANTSIFGIPASQAYRDRHAARGGISGRYELSPANGLLFALRAVDTRYVQTPPGAARKDSTDGVMLMGVDSGEGDMWRYSVLAGLQTRHFSAPQFRARTVPVADAQLLWQPSGLTSVSLRLTRAIEDAAQESLASTVATRARLVVEHEYARDFVFQVSGGVQAAENNGSTRMNFNFGARALWVINQNMRLSLSYDFSRWREGIFDSTPQDGLRLRNLAMATLRLTP
jgi:hypothetical protein